MTTLYVTEQRALVKKDGETLAVHIPADAGKGADARTVRVPLIKIDQVVIYGDATLTSPALAALLEQRVEVCFLSAYGRYRGRLSPAFSKNAPLRIEQHRAYGDPVRALALARQFVAGKLGNMRTLLLRSNRKLELNEIVRAAEMLKRMGRRALELGAVSAIDARDDSDLPGLSDDVPDAPSAPDATENSPASAFTPVGSAPDGGSLSAFTETANGPQEQQTLLGLEGMGSAAYFGVFGQLLKQELGFRRRTRRPPTDPVNALLSYGYVLLMHQVESAINVVGLDPFVGYLHAAKYGKPALALDLMEEFRPVIVDSVVLSLVNNRILTAESFEAELGAYRLTERGRRVFLEKFEERLSTEVEHPIFGYRATYKRCLELQVRLLAKRLTGEVPAYVPFLAR